MFDRQTQSSDQCFSDGLSIKFHLNLSKIKASQTNPGKTFTDPSNILEKMYICKRNGSLQYVFSFHAYECFRVHYTVHDTTGQIAKYGWVCQPVCVLPHDPHHC